LHCIPTIAPFSQHLLSISFGPISSLLLSFKPCLSDGEGRYEADAEEAEDEDDDENVRRDLELE
jgi:hypothetical protein